MELELQILGGTLKLLIHHAWGTEVEWAEDM